MNRERDSKIAYAVEHTNKDREAVRHYVAWGWDQALESTPVKNLIEALDHAIDLITSEYCSHAGLCGDGVETCYAREQFKALNEFKQSKLK